MMNVYSNSRQSAQCVAGFTFIEVMIATLVMMVIFAGVLSVLVNSANVWDNDMGLVEVQQKIRHALHGMGRELRQSQPSVITISGSNDISFSITDEITDPSSPVTYTIRYYYDSTAFQLIRENPTTGTACDVTWSDSKCSVLVGDVTAVTFCCLGGAGCTDCSNAHSVQLDLAITKTVKGRDLSLSAKEKVKLRNE